MGSTKSKKVSWYNIRWVGMSCAREYDIACNILHVNHVVHWKKTWLALWDANKFYNSRQGVMVDSVCHLSHVLSVRYGNPEQTQNVLKHKTDPNQWFSACWIKKSADLCSTPRAVRQFCIYFSTSSLWSTSLNENNFHWNSSTSQLPQFKHMSI